MSPCSSMRDFVGSPSVPIHCVAVWNFDHRRQFASDNNAGCCPEVLEALQSANPGHVAGYGSDPLTAKAKDVFRELFETDCETFFVFNGTAANSLAIGSFCSRHHSVLCHRHSHIESDECNAPGFLNQGPAIVTVDGQTGKSIHRAFGACAAGAISMLRSPEWSV